MPIEAMKAIATGGGDKLTPKQQKEVAVYKTVVTKVMHGKENRDNVLNLLRSYKDPELAVPEVAKLVVQHADSLMKTKAPNEYKLGLSGYIISDLIEIGTAAKIWPPVDPDEAKAIYVDTVQDHIHQGLKDGTIDPIELQKQTEPMMNEQQKQYGMAMGQANGVNPVVDPRATTRVLLDTQKKQMEKQQQQQQQPQGGQV